MYINSYTSFAIIGGDKRQLYMADSIYRDGYKVTLSGFDTLKPSEEIKNLSPAEAATKSEIIIFPVPSIKDGVIYAPFAEKKIELSPELLTAVSGKKIFCGMAERLVSNAKQLNKDLIYDILKREDFTVLNAVPTAEGALECALREYDGTVSGSRCLVCGYGRIGKILAGYLKALGANVTASARKAEDLAWIEANGITPVQTRSLYEENEFEIIFNTVPHLIFDSRLLAKIASKAVVIDLASLPGGVDFEACKRLGIKSVHALSLPGKTSPKKAGEIIKNTVFKMLEEEKI